MIQTKYPIVLVHGMMAKDFFFWRAFRGITDFLEAKNIPVYITNQDGVGSVTTCAQQLKIEILDIMKKENCSKVNLIAHSKGGIDARYMVSCLGMADHVASLTTISSPHHGSKVSLWLLGFPRIITQILVLCFNVFFRIMGDRRPDSLQMAKDLVPEAMADFNRNVPDAPGVYYQSFSSVAPKTRNLLLMIPYILSRKLERGDTDGMVAVASSTWGTYRGSLPRPTDHFLMAGILGSKRRLKEMGRFYRRIIQELQVKGF